MEVSNFKLDLYNQILHHNGVIGPLCRVSLTQIKKNQVISLRYDLMHQVIIKEKNSSSIKYISFDPI